MVELPSTDITEPINQYAPPNIQIYPNPFSSAIYIRGVLTSQGYTQIIMYNSLGTCLESWQFAYQSGAEQEFKLNLSDLPAGIYFVRIQTDNVNSVARVIKN
jgi:hypothetical protein